MKNKTVCIVGVGYVGLPLARVFSKKLKVTGYKENEMKKLKKSIVSDFGGRSR
jgi:UDP-N-acetyl-D-mannosaminuronate dehydrogenase